MILNPITQSLPIKLGIDITFSSCLIHSFQIITSFDLLTCPEQLLLEGTYFVNMYLNGMVNKDESLISTSLKIIKVISLSTVFVNLFFHALKQYRCFPLKQTYIFAAIFTGTFSLVHQLTPAMLSYFNDRSFSSLEKGGRLSCNADNHRSSLISSADCFSHSNPVEHFSSEKASESFLPPEDLVDQCESLLESHQDASHFVESIKQQLKEYESLDPMTVYRLFLVLQKVCTDEKLDNEHNSCIGYWLLNHGVAIEPFYEYYRAVQRILTKIATNPIEDLQRFLDGNIEALDAYYHLFSQTTNEGFQVLPLEHQVFFNSQFFERKGLEHCFSFKLVDIEQKLYKRMTSPKFLQILHHQLCVRTQDIEKIHPHAKRRLLKDWIDKRGLIRK